MHIKLRQASYSSKLSDSLKPKLQALPAESAVPLPALTPYSFILKSLAARQRGFNAAIPWEGEEQKNKIESREGAKTQGVQFTILLIALRLCAFA